jgi:hypothetical protein
MIDDLRNSLAAAAVAPVELVDRHLLRHSQARSIERLNLKQCVRPHRRLTAVVLVC